MRTQAESPEITSSTPPTCCVVHVQRGKRLSDEHTDRETNPLDTRLSTHICFYSTGADVSFAENTTVGHNTMGLARHDAGRGMAERWHTNNYRETKFS